MLYVNEITKTKNAYFVVWTTHGMVIDNITPEVYSSIFFSITNLMFCQ